VITGEGTHLLRHREKLVLSAEQGISRPYSSGRLADGHETVKSRVFNRAAKYMNPPLGRCSRFSFETTTLEGLSLGH
jgi:hypothetical protein